MTENGTNGASPDRPVAPPDGVTASPTPFTTTGAADEPRPAPPPTKPAPPSGHVSLFRRLLGSQPAPPPGHANRVSNAREIIETVVFVVVLVLLLKSFVAEAFVIPTGSMAETLYGYQKLVTCPQCSLEFPVNCSGEIEDRPPTPVTGCVCPNCRERIDFAAMPRNAQPGCNTGDRVLVAKYLYDTGLSYIEPFDVVVFKFPEEPQRNFVATNYIKRAIGKGGQTVGIHHGDLFVSQPGRLSYDSETPEPGLPLRRQMYKDSKREVLEARNPGEADPVFQILRKSPDKMLALRRLVYDNDHQAVDLVKADFPRRWDGNEVWKPDDASLPMRFTIDEKNNELGWLRYRHYVRPEGMLVGAGTSAKPQLITDVMGYNMGIPERGILQPNWVGDLMLEGTVNVQRAAGEFRLELSKGVDRFQARWSLTTGGCTLVRIDRQGNETTLGQAETSMKSAGTYRVRFANFDERLTVWVDRHLPFGAGVNYDPPTAEAPGHDRSPRVIHGPFPNDLEPASIGGQGCQVTVANLKLWRDTYYTNTQITWRHLPAGIWSDPDEWNELRNQPAMTLYVQPGHYLCMGDNSPQSSDSRTWDRMGQAGQRGGLVPESLMLGRALMVYWPLSRFGPIE